MAHDRLESQGPRRRSLSDPASITRDAKTPVHFEELVEPPEFKRSESLDRACVRTRTLTRAVTLRFDNDKMEWGPLGAAPSDQPASGEADDFVSEIEEQCAEAVDERVELWRFYLLIYGVAVLTCILSFLHDVLIEWGLKIRGGLLWMLRNACRATPTAALDAVCIVAWAAFEVVLVAFAHRCARAHPMCYGSGIPEIRCELQGTHMKGFMATGVLWAKAAGLTLAEVAGLPIGKEGPFVHCAAAITRFLAHTPLFRGALRVPGCLRHLLIVSVAAGTCSVVGVPIGGVMFALEVMPDSVWENLGYWMCLGTAIAGGVTLQLMKSMFPEVIVIVDLVPQLPGANEVTGSPFSNNNFLQKCIMLLLSAALGVICGLLGAIFVRSNIRLMTHLRHWIAKASFKGGVPSTPRCHRNRGASQNHSALVEPFFGMSLRTVAGDTVKRTSRRRAMLLCLIVAAVDGLLSAAIPVVRGTTQVGLLWKLVASDEIEWWSAGSDVVPALLHDGFLQRVPQIWSASLFFVARWILTTFALSLPVPSGCIIPCNILGALTGRIFSMVVHSGMHLLSGHISNAAHVHVQFSLMGASALTCAVCRSFSVVIVMFELVNARQEVLLNLGVASIFAINVANCLSPSIFEAVAFMKRLPEIPQCSRLLDAWDPVSGAMRTAVPMVPMHFGPGPHGVKVLAEALGRHPHVQEFAVVPEANGPSAVLGCVERSVVEAAVREGAEAFSRGAISVATQVPPSMPVKNAQLALEVIGHNDLYVMEGGELVGAVDFNDLVRSQRQRCRIAAE